MSSKYVDKEQSHMTEQTEHTMLDFAALSKRWPISTLTLRRAAERWEIKTIYLAGRRFVPLSEVQRIDRVGFGGRKKHVKNGQGRPRRKAAQ
jgi:hypothetical protein